MTIEVTNEIPLVDEESKDLVPAKYLKIFTNGKTGLLDFKAENNQRGTIRYKDLKAALANAANDNPPPG